MSAASRACFPEDLADVFSSPVLGAGVVAGEGFQEDQVWRVLGIVSGMQTIKLGQDRRPGPDVQAGIKKLPVIDISFFQVLRIDLHQAHVQRMTLGKQIAGDLDRLGAVFRFVGFAGGVVQDRQGIAGALYFNDRPDCVRMNIRATGGIKGGQG